MVHGGGTGSAIQVSWHMSPASHTCDWRVGLVSCPEERVRGGGSHDSGRCHEEENKLGMLKEDLEMEERCDDERRSLSGRVKRRKYDSGSNRYY